MALDELSFENVNGRTDRRMDDGQKVITIAHPEHNSGEINTMGIPLFIWRFQCVFEKIWDTDFL